MTFVILGGSLAGPLVFLGLFYRLVPRLQQAQQAGLMARGEAPWWDSWKEHYEAAVAEAEQPTGKAQFPAAPVVQFDSVSLTFPGRPQPALSDLSCTIAPGECLAVVGESGGGKTTLLDLVSGLLRPTSGAVRLDGVDLSEVDLEWWRRHLGLVMQDSPVFDASLLENVAWGDPEPDEGRVRRVVEMAHLAEVVSALRTGSRRRSARRADGSLAVNANGLPWPRSLSRAVAADPRRSDERAGFRIREDDHRDARVAARVVLHSHRRAQAHDSRDRRADLVLSRGAVAQTGTWETLLAEDGIFRESAIAQGIETELVGPGARSRS